MNKSVDNLDCELQPKNIRLSNSQAELSGSTKNFIKNLQELYRRLSDFDSITSRGLRANPNHSTVTDLFPDDSVVQDFLQIEIGHMEFKRSLIQQLRKQMLELIHQCGPLKPNFLKIFDHKVQALLKTQQQILRDEF